MGDAPRTYLREWVCRSGLHILDSREQVELKRPDVIHLNSQVSQLMARGNMPYAYDCVRLEGQCRPGRVTMPNQVQALQFILITYIQNFDTLSRATRAWQNTSYGRPSVSAYVVIGKRALEDEVEIFHLMHIYILVTQERLVLVSENYSVSC